jgi:acyl-CoA thioester hydrolase
MNLADLPIFHRAIIPPDYLDLMGHMNVRWYMALFDETVMQLFASFGMNETYFKTQSRGAFALQMFIRYYNEVRIGEAVALRARVLKRGEKRLHFMIFMHNETTDALAATMEGLGAHMDMSARRMSPYPPDIAAEIDHLLAQHRTLSWEAPTCGAEFKV